MTNEEFTAFKKRYNRAVRWGIHKVAPACPPEIREEYEQEAWLKIWEGIDSYDEDMAAPQTWISTIAMNVVRDELRKMNAQKRPELVFESDMDTVEDEDGFLVPYHDQTTCDITTPEGIAEAEQEAERIQSVVANSLSPALAVIHDYVWNQGLTVQETAERTGQSVETVQRYVSRIRNAMSDSDTDYVCN